MVKKFLFILVFISIFALAGCYKTKTKRITFDTRGGEQVVDWEVDIKDALNISLLPVPKKDGSTFLGWYLDEGLNSIIAENNVPSGDFTLYAKWEVNSYTIYYHSNGGTAVEQTTHLFGSNITAPNPPTREGFSFDGWFSDNSLTATYQFTTMPNADLNLYAGWQPNSYSITFDSKGGSDVAALVALYDSPITKPQEPSKPGYVFLGWYLDEGYAEEFVFSKMPLNGAHLYAKWDEASYKITLISGFAFTIDPIYLKAGEQVTLSNPTYAGYEFVGWFTDENRTLAFVDTSMPAENITLYAAWNPLLVEYRVEHYIENANDESYTLFKTDQEEDYAGEIVTASLLNFSWITENTTYHERVISGEVKGDGTLVLKRFYDRKEYTITIDGGGGLDGEGQEDVVITAKYEETITPPVFTKKGYRFLEWSIEFPSVMPYYNLQLYAKWEAVYVNYRVEHFQEDVTGETYSIVETTNHTELIDHDVEATFKNYLGFSVNASHEDSKHNGISNDDLVLKVYYSRNSYTITFKDEDGSALDIYNIEAKFGMPITTTAVHQKEGYTFVGWFTSSSATEPYEFTTMPHGGVTVYARFQVELYTITFVSNAEVSVTSIKAEYNTPIEAPTIPVRQGYIFKGWCSDEECTIPYNFTVMPAEDITLYAKWEPVEVAVTFVYNDERENTIVIGLAGAAFDEVIPGRIGYTFEGWYKNTSLTDPFVIWIMPVTNTTLYAKWTPKSYTITFVSGVEGLDIEPLTQLYESILVLPVPSRDGYDFEGWFLDEEGLNQFTNLYMPLNGATLYAKWKEHSDINSIDFALSRNPGTAIITSGFVYAKLIAPYFGFYIMQDDLQIFCLGDQSLVNVGDEVMVTGYFERWNTVPMINGITDINVLSGENLIPESMFVSLDDLNSLDRTDQIFGRRFQIEGIIYTEGDETYLVSPVSLKKVKIIKYQQGMVVFDDSIKSATGEFILADFKDGNWELILVEGTLEETNLTDQELVDKVKASLEYLAENQTFRPLDEFFMPQVDFLGWTTITSRLLDSDALYYDEETGRLSDSEVNYNVNFEVTITRNEVTESFNLTLFVTPYEITTIRDFLDLDYLNSTYYLRGIIICSTEYSASIQDETGVWLFYYEASNEYNRLELGSEIIISISVDYMGIVNVEKVLSLENEIPAAIPLSAEELAALTEDDYYMVGTYVELRGIYQFIYNDWMEYQVPSLLVGDNIVPILGDERTLYLNRKYENMEMIIRGYLDTDWKYGWVLMFDNNRLDFQVPSYTDAELATFLQQSITRAHQDLFIYAYEKFTIPWTHPILGGEISWTLSPETALYYDEDNERFINITAPLPIVINCVIKVNDVTINFAMNKTVMPELITPIQELPQMQYGERVKVKGTVVYRHFDFFYLQDDAGYIVLVTAFDHNFLVGDVLLFEADVYSDPETYLVLDTELNDCDVLSVGNPVTLSPTPISIENLIKLDPESNPLVSYFQVTGYLKNDSGLKLYYGDDYILIHTCDEYTYYELLAYDNQVITINVYLNRYEEVYRKDYFTREVMFTGLAHELSESAFTDQQKIDFIKDTLNQRYEMDYLANQYHYFLITHPLYGGSIVYEDLDPVDNPINFTSGYIGFVSVPVKKRFEATIQVGEIIETISLEFSIIPRVSDDTEQVTIAEFKNQLGSYYKIYAKVIGIFDNVVLIKDETGEMYVDKMYVSPYNHGSTLNHYFYFYGTAVNFRGRAEMDLSYTERDQIGTSEEINYEPTTISSIISLDHRNDDVFGKTVELKGTVICEKNRWQEFYYLVDGFDRVLLDSYNRTKGNSIHNFVGYNVIIKGYVYGLNQGFYTDVWSIQLANEYIILDEYSDDEIVDLIARNLLADYDDTYYSVYDEIELYLSNYFNFDVNVMFEVISGGDAIDFNEERIIIYPTDIDRDIIFSATISKGEVIKTINFTLHIKGLPLSSVDDLFEDEPGTIKVYLHGTLIHVLEMGAYFLINEEVYFLENILMDDYYDRPGYEYLITGYKTEIDGVTNISFNIGISYLEDGDGSDLDPYLISIRELYEADPNEISRKLLYVYGTLKYDLGSDIYYLEHLDERIYLRFAFSHPKLYGDISIKNGYMPEYLIGEEVMIRLLFPNKWFKGKYLLDAFGSPFDAIDEMEHAPQEKVDAVIKYLERTFGGQTYYSFDNLYLEENVRGVSVSWELVNEEDATYIHAYDYSMKIKWITSPVIISYQVTATYEEDGIEPITKTVIIDLMVEPRAVITIAELYRSKPYEDYVIKGIVQELNDEMYAWLLVKDETGSLLVHTSDDYLDGEIFRVGDEIVVYGSYDYSYNDPKPHFDYVNEIKILSRDNPVSEPTPVVLTLEEVYALDYLDPYSAYQYITVEGEIFRYGSTWYPYYVLVDGNYKIEFYYAKHGDLDGKSIITELAGTGRVKITGYLYGLYSAYHFNQWELMFAGVFEKVAASA